MMARARTQIQKQYEQKDTSEIKTCERRCIRLIKIKRMRMFREIRKNKANKKKMQKNQKNGEWDNCERRVDDRQAERFQA